jgi:hypothetical protein
VLFVLADDDKHRTDDAIQKMSQIVVRPKKDETSDKLSFSKYESGTTAISHPTELGEALRELNTDIVENNSMSTIDMRSNLHPFEVASVLAMDSLISLNIVPKSCLSFTRQKKRLAVSTQALGRKQIVELATGKKEQDKAVMTLSDRFKSAFGGDANK